LLATWIELWSTTAVGVFADIRPTLYKDMFAVFWTRLSITDYEIEVAKSMLGEKERHRCPLSLLVPWASLKGFKKLIQLRCRLQVGYNEEPKD
jgi:hypothetical protein